MVRPRPLLLLGIALLLIVQLFIRVHHPLVMGAFWDENSHITRARTIYDQLSVESSHGKLLLYFWIGLFRPAEHQAALVVARLAVALFSLIGSAAMLAVVKWLFGRRAMLPALAFYAVLPYALLFERMAFADPFAAALGGLLVWRSMILARHPSRQQGAVVGLLAAMMTMAKLTASGVIGMVPVALVLWGDLPLPALRWPAIKPYARDLWRTYRPALITLVIVMAIPWIIVLLATAYIQLVEDRQVILLDTYLFDDETNISSVFGRLEDTFVTKTGLLLWHPMTILLAALLLIVVWKRPKAGLMAAAWLLAVWAPITLFVWELQSRYLMASTFALAVIFGGGTVLAGDWIADRLKRPQARAEIGAGIAAAALIVWLAGFALPFIDTATTHPDQLELPKKDTTNYLSGLFTTWGSSRAFIDLSADVPAADRVNGEIPVFGVMRVCAVHELFMQDAIDWDCIGSIDFTDQKVPRDVTTWPLRDDAPIVYVITDYLPPDPAPDAHWTLFKSYPRPYQNPVDQPVTVWRVMR